MNSESCEELCNEEEKEEKQKIVSYDNIQLVC